MEQSARSRVGFTRQTGEVHMFRKLMSVVVIGGSLALSACNTVRGAAEDVESVANCTENAIDGTGNC